MSTRGEFLLVTCSSILILTCGLTILDTCLCHVHIMPVLASETIYIFMVIIGALLTSFGSISLVECVYEYVKAVSKKT
jgi:hypothetical protein